MIMTSTKNFNMIVAAYPTSPKCPQTRIHVSTVMLLLRFRLKIRYTTCLYRQANRSKAKNTYDILALFFS